MQAIGRQPQRAPDGAPMNYERHRPAAGAKLPQFVRDEFDAFLKCGILAHGLLRLRCGDCGHNKLVALVEEQG